MSKPVRKADFRPQPCRGGWVVLRPKLEGELNPKRPDQIARSKGDLGPVFLISLGGWLKGLSLDKAGGGLKVLIHNQGEFNVLYLLKTSASSSSNSGGILIPGVRG